MTKQLTKAQRSNLGNIIASGGINVCETGQGRHTVGGIRTSTIAQLCKLGLIRSEVCTLDQKTFPAHTYNKSYTARYYATAAGCIAFGHEIATAE